MIDAEYALWADLILVLHVLIALFISMGLIVILVGWQCSWEWPRHRWFRAFHLVGILVIAVESWIGVICPLTEWEQVLRIQAGQGAYEGGFIAQWMGKLLFYDAPLWLFGMIYTLALALTIAAWWAYPPRRNQ